MKRRFLVIGELGAQLTLARNVPSQYRHSLGGILRFARALQGRGAKVFVAGALGCDLLGDTSLLLAKEAGINVGFVSRYPNFQTPLWVVDGQSCQQYGSTAPCLQSTIEQLNSMIHNVDAVFSCNAMTETSKRVLEQLCAESQTKLCEYYADPFTDHDALAKYHCELYGLSFEEERRSQTI